MIKVTRASDSTSQDIFALSNGPLNWSALNTFCNATTCKVGVYDQMGHAGNDAITGTIPPITIAAIPYVAWDGASRLTMTSFTSTGAQPYWMSMVSLRTTCAGSCAEQAFISFGGATEFGYFAATGNLIIYAGNGWLQPALTDGAVHSIIAKFNGATSQYDIDNAGIQTGGADIGANALSATAELGSRSGANFANGRFYEGLIFKTNTPNVTALAANQCTRYSLGC
jgi:hypothetical protein